MASTVEAGSRSYSASSWMRERIEPTSEGVAERTVTLEGDIFLICGEKSGKGGEKNEKEREKDYFIRVMIHKESPNRMT